MSMPGWMRDTLKFCFLVIAVWCAVQAVQYGSLISSVDKTLALQLSVYHDQGPWTYRASVLREIGRLGLRVDDHDLAIVEDRDHDEMRVELRYDLPLNVAVFTFPRRHVARTRTTILD